MSRSASKVKRPKQKKQKNKMGTLQIDPSERTASVAESFNLMGSNANLGLSLETSSEEQSI